jgi:hypothetical protein
MRFLQIHLYPYLETKALPAVNPTATATPSRKRRFARTASLYSPSKQIILPQFRGHTRLLVMDGHLPESPPAADFLMSHNAPPRRVAPPARISGHVYPVPLQRGAQCFFAFMQRPDRGHSFHFRVQPRHRLRKVDTSMDTRPETPTENSSRSL